MANVAKIPAHTAPTIQAKAITSSAPVQGRAGVFSDDVQLLDMLPIIERYQPDLWGYGFPNVLKFDAAIHAPVAEAYSTENQAAAIRESQQRETDTAG